VEKTSTTSKKEKEELQLKIDALQKGADRQRAAVETLMKDAQRLQQVESRKGFGSRQRSKSELRIAAKMGRGDASFFHQRPQVVRDIGLNLASAKGAGAGLSQLETDFDGAASPDGDLGKEYKRLGEEFAKTLFLAAEKGAQPQFLARGDSALDPSFQKNIYKNVKETLGADEIVKTLDEIQTRNEFAAQKREEVLAKADNDFFTSRAEKKRATELAQKIVEEGKGWEKEKQEDDIAKYLEMTGLSKGDARRGAKALTGTGSFDNNRGLFTDERASAILRDLGDSRALDWGNKYMLEEQVKNIGSTPPAGDLVMQIGSEGVKFAQRVDPGDVGVFAKAGGALANAKGGGGGGVNVYHLYGEGPGVLNTITKAQQSGLLS